MTLLRYVCPYRHLINKGEHPLLNQPAYACKLLHMLQGQLPCICSLSTPDGANAAAACQSGKPLLAPSWLGQSTHLPLSGRAARNRGVSPERWACLNHHHHPLTSLTPSNPRTQPTAQHMPATTPGREMHNMCASHQRTPQVSGFTG